MTVKDKLTKREWWILKTSLERSYIPIDPIPPGAYTRWTIEPPEWAALRAKLSERAAGYEPPPEEVGGGS